MANLEVVSRLYTVTRNGQREVQLCIGDITTLPKEDKVDVIVISALPFAYTPTRTSVIGALWFNLNLSVRELSKNHIKEDLRETHCCWISKPLRDHLPYRQLICYEENRAIVKRGSRAAVGNLFRAMMPIFNNTDKSVITPLLATGVQNVPRQKMLRNLVMTAIEWMHMGLPLQCFKVVVYAKTQDDPFVATCQKIFEDLRINMAKYESRLKMKNPPLVTDIFMVYCQENEDLKGKVCDLFKGMKEKAVITSSYQIQTHEDSWQYDVHKEMAKSKRVVLLLTVDFLSSEICIDAFNVAMCVNRQCRRPLLAPFYIEQCNVPQYMAMMQWINCKQCDMGKIERAIVFVSEDISADTEADNVAYDVFLSYSHRNLEDARKVLAKLQQANPELKVFFDYDELRTGISWQQTLYDAVSRASCVVALVSPDYMASAVCQEEFNLAMAQHLAENATTELIPVIIKPVDTYFSSTITPVVACEEDFDTQTTKVCQDVVRWLKDGTKSHIFSPVEEPIDYHEAAHRYRRHLFEKHYTTVDNVLTIKDNNRPPSSPPEHTSIRFSFVASTQSYVTFVERVLQLQQPGTRFQFGSKVHGNLDETTEYDLSVVFLSEDYSRSTREIEELTVLLGKRRSSGHQKALYVVVVGRLSTNPLYLHLIPTHTNLLDDFWEERPIWGLVPGGEECQELMKVREVIKDKGHVPLTDIEVLGLKKVVCDILTITNGQSLPRDSHCGEGIILNVIKTNMTVPYPVISEKREVDLSAKTEETEISTSTIPREPNKDGFGDRRAESESKSRSVQPIVIESPSGDRSEPQCSSQSVSTSVTPQSKKEVSKSTILKSRGGNPSDSETESQTLKTESSNEDMLKPKAKSNTCHLF